MNSPEEIAKFLNESFHRRMIKTSLCSCGNKKAHNFKTCCRCNNRIKKNAKKDIKTSA